MSRILIIEDDRSIAELERDYLEVEGFGVDIEPSGERGLSRATEGGYDLVILDLMLPGVDGFNICRRLRQTAQIPIIMVSARSEDVDKIRGLGLGADDYVTKPFSPGELVARVKSHLRRHAALTQGRAAPHGSVVIGGLEIDTAARRVSVEGREVSLTAKEFEILVMLCAEPDRVFTREQIFDRVWGQDRFGDIATVTVHIRRIREKVEKDPSRPRYIETVWGVGYRLRLS